MTLNDCGDYKMKIFNTILNNEEIGKLILDKNYNKDTAYEVMKNDNVFPFLYVPDVQKETRSYICVDVEVPRTTDMQYKDMKIIVWCYCSKSIMACNLPGYIGTRADIICTMVDNLFNKSREFGIGRLKLQSKTILRTESSYYGHALIYTCTEFE